MLCGDLFAKKQRKKSNFVELITLAELLGQRFPVHGRIGATLCHRSLFIFWFSQYKLIISIMPMCNYFFREKKREGFRKQ